MSDRFPMLQLLAWLTGLIFAAALCLGLYLFAVAGQPDQIRAETFPFPLVPVPALIALGASLTLTGLLGFVMAGGVRVLIAIEESTRKAGSKSTIAER